MLSQPGCKSFAVHLQCYEEGIQTPQSRHERALCRPVREAVPGRAAGRPVPYWRTHRSGKGLHRQRQLRPFLQHLPHHRHRPGPPAQRQERRRGVPSDIHAHVGGADAEGLPKDVAATFLHGGHAEGHPPWLQVRIGQGLEIRMASRRSEGILPLRDPGMPLQV